MKDEYRRIAPVYDLLLDGFNEGLRGIGIRLYPPSPGMKVLDVCCGTGSHLDLYLRSGCEVHGVDLSPAMLSVARKRLGGRATLTHADASSLPYADDTFDLVVCMLALHEMAPQARDGVIAEMARVMRSRGGMLLIDFHPGPFRGLKGRIANAVITVAEFFAGQEHFANSRIFLRSGGLTPHIGRAGLSKQKERIVGGDTLAVIVCGRNHQA